VSSHQCFNRYDEPTVSDGIAVPSYKVKVRLQRIPDDVLGK